MLGSGITKIAELLLSGFARKEGDMLGILIHLLLLVPSKRSPERSSGCIGVPPSPISFCYCHGAPTATGASHRLLEWLP